MSIKIVIVDDEAPIRRMLCIALKSEGYEVIEAEVVSHLRQKLGDDPAEPYYIRTEAGVGNRLMYPDPTVISSA